jgi:hypothetical protein
MNKLIASLIAASFALVSFGAAAADAPAAAEAKPAATAEAKPATAKKVHKHHKAKKVAKATPAADAKTDK